MKNKYLEDPDGNKSSKRLYGAIFGALGAIMGVVGWLVALCHPIGNQKIVIEMPLIFGGLCMFLLTGGTAAEHIGKMIKNVRNKV